MPMQAEEAAAGGGAAPAPRRRYVGDAPMSRAATAAVAREAIERWRLDNDAARERIRLLIRAQLSPEAIAARIPPSFFGVYSPKVISGRMLGLFFQLVEMSARGTARLTFLNDPSEGGFMGITTVEIAPEHRAALDAMPFASQGALLNARDRSADVKRLVWREATFIESETPAGGLMMRHVPFVRRIPMAKRPRLDE